MVARRLATATAGLFGAAVVASVIATVTTPSDSPRPGDVAVSVSDFAFVPEEVRVPAGGTVRVHNDDLIVHTFSIRDTGLSRTLHEAGAPACRSTSLPGRTNCSVRSPVTSS